MNESSWVSGTGIATGLIGSITGIAGLIMGWASLKKVNAIKALDLRLELKKLSSATGVLIDELNSRMKEADSSRRNNLAARGMFKSSMMDQWQMRVQADYKKLNELKSEVAIATSQIDSLKIDELEPRLVALHETNLRIQSLYESYKESLDSDAEEVKQRRIDQRNAFG